MKMEIKYTTKFRKQYHKATKEIKRAFAQTLDLFLEDPHHPVLRNHTLKREYSGHRSIDITADWRAIFVIEKNRKGEEKILFKFIGTHKMLYE
ncbi:MAG: type II toxin-antitoxin system mRNA interferase toxin, RelE/StbE family [Patescibacteria group bacterium]